MPTAEAPAFEYETFEFKRKSYHIDEGGAASLVNSRKIEKVEVVIGWQQYQKGGKPAGGYLSKGLSKYAFRVHFLFTMLIVVLD